jgi:hypothetical protein
VGTARQVNAEIITSSFSLTPTVDKNEAIAPLALV